MDEGWESLIQYKLVKSSREWSGGAKILDKLNGKKISLETKSDDPKVKILQAIDLGLMKVQEESQCNWILGS